MLSGIGRVIAFIGVGVLGALVLGAVRNGAPTGGAGRRAADHGAAGRATALAGILDRPRDGLCVAGGDADRTVSKAGCAGAGLSVAAAVGRSGRRWRHRTSRQSNISSPTRSRRRSSRFWCRSGVMVAMLAGSPGRWHWSGAVPCCTPRLADARAAADRRLGSAARGAWGMGAYATETIQGLAELVMFNAAGRRRDGFMDGGAGISGAAAGAAGRSVVPDRARWRSRPG